MHIVLLERKLCRHKKHEVCSFEKLSSPSLIEELRNHDNVDRSVAFVPRLPMKSMATSAIVGGGVQT